MMRRLEPRQDLPAPGADEELSAPRASNLLVLRPAWRRKWFALAVLVLHAAAHSSGAQITQLAHADF